MADYTVLTQDEQDDIIVGFMQAQEREAYCHEINIDRYNNMIASLKDGEFKTRCKGLLAETQSRLTEVQTIIAATTPQLPSTERITASVARLKAKESTIKTT